MEDSAQLTQIIKGVLQPYDAKLRYHSEQILTTLRNNNPNQLIITYLRIIQGQSPLECRHFSASQLRLCFSNFLSPTYSNLWHQLLPEVQITVKKVLFDTIYLQPDLSMKKHIAYTIGEVAGFILGSQDDAWPEFRENVWKLFKDQNISSIMAGFYILESFLKLVPEHFKQHTSQLYVLFKSGLEHQNSKLKLSALKCLTSYLQVFQIRKYPGFRSLTLSLLQAVYVLVQKEKNCEGLEALSEMLTVEPWFFKQNFKELVEVLTKIFRMTDVEGGVRRMATQILLDLVQKSPALFRKSKPALEFTIEMVCSYILEINEEVDQSWKSPPEGYSEQLLDQYFETTRFGTLAIDRLIRVVGMEYTLPVLWCTINQLLQSQDWRYKHAAVLIFSQMGEYLENVEEISPVLPRILGFLKHPNAMMRYAACHAIGQIADDMQPRLQQTYGDSIFTALMQILESEVVGRVLSHAASALANLLQGMKFAQIQSHLNSLMNLLLRHATNGISLVQESVLSAICSTVEIARYYFNRYLRNTLDLLQGFHSAPKYAGSKYNQLKGQSIEVMTIIASSVGAQIFRPAAAKVIQLLTKVQGSQLERGDPQMSFILAGWHRLCLVYEKELGSSLESLLPGLFTLAENVIQEEIASVNSSSPKQQKCPLNTKKDKNINTYSTKKAQIAISMLNTFVEKLQQLYTPYIEKTAYLLCSIMKENLENTTKKQACKCLPKLISVVKTSNQPLAINLTKLFITTLLQAIEQEQNSEIVILQLSALKEVLEQLDLCFLSELEVQEFSEKMVGLLKSKDQKKESIRETLDDLDEEQKEMANQEIKEIEQAQVEISAPMGALFKTHKTMALGLASLLIANVLPRVFTENQAKSILKFGIFLIDDMVEYLGYQLLQTYWASFGQLLLKYTSEKSCELRQAACYGLGVFAAITPSAVLNAETVSLWLNTLQQAIKLPKGSQKARHFGNCRDNAVAALGKIIKQHSSLLNLRAGISLWIENLPLRNDKEQGMLQNQLLADMMFHQPELILGGKKTAGLQKVLRIYGEIIGDRKLCNDTVVLKIRTHLNQLKADQWFIQWKEYIWEGLTHQHRQNLADFLQ